MAMSLIFLHVGMVWALLGNPEICGCMVQWVLVNCMGLSGLVGDLLGCTALMRANSPKHPPGCL